MPHEHDATGCRALKARAVTWSTTPPPEVVQRLGMGAGKS